MLALSKLNELENYSLTRLSSDLIMHNQRFLMNIFLDVLDNHQYVFIDTKNFEYKLCIGKVYINTTNKTYYTDTPNLIIPLTKNEFKECYRWLREAEFVGMGQEICERLSSTIVE